MAIPDIPSIEEIKNRIVSDVTDSINQVVPSFFISFVRVLASAIASMHYLTYQAILWVYKQIFPSSADYFNLILLGRIVDVTPKEATNAIILCTVPGSGSEVTQGTTFIYTNDVTYRVETTTLIVSGEALNVPMRALTSGGIGNVADGEILNLTSSTLGLDGTAEVTSTDTSGADEESEDSFAARVSLRYRIKFIAGTPGGYALYGLETPNFTWVGPYADEDIHKQVNIYGRVDNQTDGIPTSSQLAELEEYCSFDQETGKEIRRAIGDELNTLAISRRVFDLEIFINNSNSGINAEIESAENDFIDTLEPFIQGVSSVRRDVLTNTDTAGVADDVAERNGAKVTQVVITDTVTGLTETNYSFYGGEFGKWGTITFTVVL